MPKASAKTQDDSRERVSDFYARRRAAGLCINCGDPSLDLRCLECTEKNRVASRQHMSDLYARRRAAGLCINCETPTGGPWRCTECAEKRRKREKGKGPSRPRTTTRKSNDSKTGGAGEGS